MVVAALPVAPWGVNSNKCRQNAVCDGSPQPTGERGIPVEMAIYQDKCDIQIPNSLPGTNRESSCRLRYVQYYRLQQRPVIGIHQCDLRPVGIAVVQFQVPVT